LLNFLWIEFQHSLGCIFMNLLSLSLSSAFFSNFLVLLDLVDVFDLPFFKVHLLLDCNCWLLGPQVSPESRTSNAGTGVYINNTDSTLLMTCHGSGTGQAVTTTNNSNSNVVTPRNGAPLSHLLGEDTSDEEEIISVSVTPYSNSPSPVVPVLAPQKQEPFPEHKRPIFSRCSRRGI
jgi:hypothetical protein